MILALDGPIVVLPARAAAMLARPLERLVADARRQGVQVEPCVLEALADCERVRRLLVAAQVPQTVPAAEPAEPVSGASGVQPEHEPNLSTEDAASLVGCSPSYIRRQARERRLGTKVGTGWRFAPGDIAILVEDRRPVAAR